MAFELGSIAREVGYRLIAHDTIDSTSAEAMRLARAGDSGRLWVVAREQTAGHGRRGLPWQTPAGNLAASLLMPVSRMSGNTATLGFAAGLALDTAIRQVAPGLAVHIALDEAGSGQDRLRLKWPNDVLVDGAKIAGVLLEAVDVADRPRAVVIGIGVNVCHAPEGVPYPATSLVACGAEATPEALFTELADAWVEAVGLWASPAGFSALRDRWLARAAGLGGPIAVRLGDDIFRGTFETIDEEGRLIVRASNGVTQTISAGDVHFGAAATVEH